MGTPEGAGWAEASQGGTYSEGEGATPADLSYTADEVAGAALVQDEIDYADHKAVDEAAAMRHFGKDPRDLDPRDML